jgi:hypothetical protein
MKTLFYSLAFLFLFQVSGGQDKVALSGSLSERRHQIVCVAYSPDSRLIATGGFDNRIIIWDSETGAVNHRLTDMRSLPLSITFSLDSKYVIAGGKDSRFTIWDAVTGELIRSVRAHRDDITGIAIQSDNIIATSSKDRTIKIWDFNGTLLRDFTGHRRDVMAVDFSSDGKRIISGSADGTVKEWDIETGTVIRSIDAHDGWVRTVAYNHNSTLIASGGDDGKINIWNRSSGELQNSIIAHGSWLETLSFSPDGRYIVSGGHDNYLVVVNAMTGEIVFNSPRQNYYVLSTSFDPSGQKLISCVLNSTDLSIWDVSSLSINAAAPGSTRPSKRSEIIWQTADNLETSNLTFRINAKIASETPLSSVDIYLNNNRFASRRDFDQREFPIELDFENIVYLNEGKNEIKLISYNDAGESVSDLLTISYKQPEPLAAHTEVPESKQQELVATHTEVPEPAKETETGEAPVEKKPQVPEEPIQAETETPVLTELLMAPLPKNPPNPYRFALIIGNEDYSSYQSNLETESDVAFAINDAKAFREYAISVLGVPVDNVIFLTNARAIEMDDAVRKLNPIIRALNGKAEIFFYYAGHGFPDERTREPFLIPVDVSGTNLRFAVSIKELYQSLTEHPSARITVFLDACFSGGAREQGLLAARAVRVRPREDRLAGNLVVFTASSGNESSLPYKEKQHGLFTWYLLNKLRDTGGDISYKELSDFLSTQVGVRSVMVNNMPQTPQTNVSFDILETWEDWKIN